MTTTTTPDPKQDAILLGEMNNTMLKLAWILPFFSIPAARARLCLDSEGKLCKTACVTPRGRIYWYPDFWASLSPPERQFVMAHELMHPMMGHHKRLDGRDPQVANQAQDMAINQILKEASMTVPKSALLPSAGRETWCFERIYDALIQEQQEQEQDQNQSAPGSGCGMVDDGEGNSDQDDSDSGDADPFAGKSEDEIEGDWRETAIQAEAMQKACGKGKGKALARINDLPATKLKWAAVLRNGTALAQASQGRDSQTWSRRGRRSASVGPQFPGWQSAVATLCAVVDSSGSMSDAALAQCAAECASAAQESGVAIYLIVHDHGVQWESWIRPGKAPATIQHAVSHGRGGTCAREAYECAGRPRRCKCDPTERCGCVRRPHKFDVFVHLTDCGLSWPTWPKNSRKKIVARIDSWGDAHVPAGAKVIDIETPQG